MDMFGHHRPSTSRKFPQRHEEKYVLHVHDRLSPVAEAYLRNVGVSGIQTRLSTAELDSYVKPLHRECTMLRAHLAERAGSLLDLLPTVLDNPEPFDPLTM